MSRCASRQGPERFAHCSCDAFNILQRLAPAEVPETLTDEQRDLVAKLKQAVDVRSSHCGGQACE